MTSAGSQALASDTAGWRQRFRSPLNAIVLDQGEDRIVWRASHQALRALALVTALTAMSVVGCLLLLYRWIAARRPRFALVVYLLILVALVPATVFTDTIFLRSGALTFGGRYTLAHDVLLGEAGFGLPLLLYALFRRWFVRRTGLIDTELSVENS